MLNGVCRHITGPGHFISEVISDATGLSTTVAVLLKHRAHILLRGIVNHIRKVPFAISLRYLQHWQAPEHELLNLGQWPQVMLRREIVSVLAMR